MPEFITDAAQATVDNMTHMSQIPPESLADMASLRAGFKELVRQVDRLVPNDRPRELAMAFRCLEDALQYAIAGVARSTGTPSDD